MLPPALARRLLAWAERTGRLGKVYFSMHVRTTTIVWGFLRLWLLARLRWWRPRTCRYHRGAGEIERWLDAIRAAARARRRAGARDRRVRAPDQGLRRHA